MLVILIVNTALIIFGLIRQEKQMSAIDDLKAADAAETAELATVAQAVTDEITRVNALIASIQPGASDADIAAVAADLNTHVTNLQTIATSLATVGSQATS